MQLSYNQISDILELSKNEIENNQKYRFLYKRTLFTFWEKRINKKTYFCLYISTDDLEQIEFSQIEDNISQLNNIINNNNFIRIDNFGNVIKKEHKSFTNDEMKTYLLDLSKNYYVFFFGEDGINRYANGAILEDKNVFYTAEERMKYFRKKDISKINEVVREYANTFLTQQYNYMCFFADDSTLRQIKDGDKFLNKNILKNRPEHYMRDQFRQYLTDHMQYTFTIEPELGQSKRELDIYFDVKGELYFIEIKWLGKTINKDGTALSTTFYDNKRVEEGVIQSLEYIQELSNTSETNFRCGYLAVFDCRDEKGNINTTDFSYVENNLKNYLQLFAFLPIINVDKRHHC